MGEGIEEDLGAVCGATAEVEDAGGGGLDVRACLGDEVVDGAGALVVELEVLVRGPVGFFRGRSHVGRRTVELAVVTLGYGRDSRTER